MNLFNYQKLLKYEMLIVLYVSEGALKCPMLFLFRCNMSIHFIYGSVCQKIMMAEYGG